MKYREIEFKYRVDTLSIASFNAFCQDRKPEKFIEASGFDHFYDKAKEPDAFCRHRIGPDYNQLTFKRKTENKNNYIRVEHNINLEREISKKQISAFLKEFGYSYNTSVFKTCFVYFFEWYILSYYVCYNTEMKEIGRFMEIEADENYNWATEQDAWNAVQAMEKICKPLGLTSQMRIKRSLFELYKQENK